MQRLVAELPLQSLQFAHKRDNQRTVSRFGINVPHDLGVVRLNKTDKGYASMNQNSELMGAAAVDLVVSMIHRQESGLSKVSQRLMIDGTWNDGYSVWRIRPGHPV